MAENVGIRFNLKSTLENHKYSGEILKRPTRADCKSAV